MTSLETWRASHFTAFAGATLELAVPITQAVLDDVVSRELMPRVPQLRTLTVVVLAGNRVEVVVATDRWRWLPPLTIVLALATQVAPGPRIRMEVVQGGIAGTLAPWMGALGALKHPALSMSARSIEVELARLLPPCDASTLERWFVDGRVTTEPGIVWIAARFALRS